MSNFKDTVYSILNEDARDTDQEIRRKANTAALMNNGLKGQELVAAIMKYDASKKRSAAEVSAAADNRGREEAVGMVASGEATSMGDARNRMGVRDQVAAERARMAKNPVREVGIANPSSQIGGAGTQYGNSPNRAPETEAEIKYRTGTSAPMADNDPITGKPILFSGRNKRNSEQKIIPGLDVPAQEAGPWHEFDVQNGIYDEKTETEDNQQYLPPAKTFKADTTPGSEPGGWEGESQAMADLHNTPAWQKLWAAGQDPTTRKNMEASQKRQEEGRAANKARNDEQSAKFRANAAAVAAALRSATFERGSNGVQRMVRPGSGGGGNGGGGGGFGGGAGSNGVQRMVQPGNDGTQGGQGSKDTQGSNDINNYGSAGSQTSPDPDGPGAGGSNFNTGTTEVHFRASSGYFSDPLPSNISDATGRQGQTPQSGISTSAAAATGRYPRFPDGGIPYGVSNDDPAENMATKVEYYTNPKTGNVGRYSGKKKLPSGKLPGIMTDGYSHNKALTFFAEQLKRKYIEEEVVNPENQPMTKSEISHRDRIRHKSPAKDARIVKGPRGRLDTSEEAKYRLATYITMRGRKGKKKENK